jgi:small subunit ribosomal protein S17
MKRILMGTIVSTKMQKTAVVQVTDSMPHPLYKKLIKRDTKFSADIGEFTLKVGDKVKIVETKPVSKTKFFKISEVIK